MALQDRRLAVVTSNFHMPRTQGIFNHIFALGGEALHQNKDWYAFGSHNIQLPPDDINLSKFTWRNCSNALILCASLSLLISFKTHNILSADGCCLCGEALKQPRASGLSAES